MILLTGSLAFQENLAQFSINPRTPFQRSPVPPTPDYQNPGAWALWPQNSEVNEQVNIAAIDASSMPKADIFFIHDTTYISKATWNGAIDDPQSRQILQEIAIPNGLGPFVQLGDLYAPYYRQATLFARFTHKFDGLSAYNLAFEDVQRAFKYYLDNADPERPLILVGYGQGGFHILSLLQAYFSNQTILQQRISAVYIIDYPVTLSMFEGAYSGLKPCRDQNQTGCIISYNAYTQKDKSDIERARTRTLLWQKETDKLTGSKIVEGFPRSIQDSPILCINPLSWKLNDDSYYGPKNHLGAASSTGLLLDQIPAIIENEIGTQCRDGILIIDRPKKRFLRESHFFGQQWRTPPFNLFFADLQKDATHRLKLHTPILADKVRDLIPIEETVDLQDNPINKVPN